MNVVLNLPEEIKIACAPLFDVVPFAQTMEHLIGSHPHDTALVEKILTSPALRNRADLEAGLWLYVDDLDRSHKVSQGLDDATGAYWHGIMHRREGDFSNSHYWMRKAIGHPLREMEPKPDPDALIDEVAQAHGADATELVSRQHEEWKTLFEWCAADR